MNKPLKVQKKLRIAYVICKFPKLSETFILYEMLYLLNSGIGIEIFPLVLVKNGVKHQEIDRFKGFVHYYKIFSHETLSAQVYWLLRKPFTYCKIWLDAIVGNIASPKYLSRAIIVVPLAAAYAIKMINLKIDKIHAHYATHSCLAAFCIRKLTGLPYSFTTHAHDIFVIRTMLRQKIEESSMVVTISDYNKKLLCKLYGDKMENKINVIRCGVDFKKFGTIVQRSKHKVPFILCTGSLEEYKGHTYLLDACKILKEKGIRFRCILIGQGILKEAILKQMFNLNLNKTVRVLGGMPHHKVQRALATASVYVQPSIIMKNGKMEGIPVALMEALAMELPVVTTSISGIPELVEHNVTGLLVPQKDPVALADALERLIIDNELGIRLAKEGRKRVQNEYNLEKNAGRLYENFLELHRMPDYQSDHF